MFQNIKADIIYYKTNTDFEMEFNLCGCCRMRLLTDKSGERKNLIANLSRAVSRSRIIMVVGSLFGDEGIIKTISAAIGKETALVDNKACGIDSSAEIEIINGSTPLVTQDGIFGGCIIESGPQTMILLTDSKNIRKSIMNTLIHPYIEEIYAVELTSKQNSAETEETEGTEETEEISETDEVAETEETEEILKTDEVAEIEETEEISETDEVAETEETESVEEQSEETIAANVTQTEETKEKATEENSEPETVKEPEPKSSEVNFVMDDGEVEVTGGMTFETEGKVTEPDEEEYELYAESRKIRRKETKFYNKAYGDFEIENSGIIMEEDEEEYTQGPSFNIALTIIIAVILALLALLCFCIFYVPSRDGISASEFVKNIFETLFG